MKSLLFLRGRFFCLCSSEPFTTRPVFGVCLRPSSSSVWFVSSATFFSLSLSLRRWGTPNLFGLGFPLCFFILDTLSALDPYALLVTYTQASPRTCFFFFFSSRRRRSFLVRCFLVSGLVGVGGLGGWFFRPWSWSLSGGCFVSVSFLGLVALSFFWVGGVPLAAFSRPPAPVAFLSSGWVGFPLPCFPGVFPMVLPCSFASCIFSCTLV